MRRKKATINDVAERAGVSTGTVSAVINDRPTVRPETKERVADVIKLLGYHPSPSARILGSTDTQRRVLHKSIGLIVKEIDSPFYSDLILGVQGFLTEKGYTTFVCSSEGDYQAEGKLIDVFRSRFVDGAIIAPILHEQVDLTHLFLLGQAEYPFVILERVPGLQVNAVAIDNVSASETAVRHLIDIGHERIIHIAGPPHTRHTRDRILGFQKAFSHSRLAYSDESIVSGGSRIEDGYSAAMRVFGQTSAQLRPTAVSCFNDLVAIGALRAVIELGLRVPEDVSIIGFDDIRSASYSKVSLTTVRQPAREMGRTSAEMIVDQLESEHTVERKEVVLEAELIVRDSTRTLRSIENE
ncbi:MAG: LacI family DNA-binding transcriptional regulator [Rhodothermales bacterium]|nr:LacI family DNA-binding transcriptional regulator [Rhodothermales bacterium]